MQPRLRINEIYKSIQGESTHAGLPCTFVRLTGCHLRCTYCDSEHAFYAGKWMSLDEILAAVEQCGAPMVEITGGEPLLQPHCGTLAKRLLDAGYKVLCETAGALPIDRLPPGVIRIMDLKCPSSGEVDANHWPNIDLLNENDEVKFVIGSREDYEWTRDVIRRYDLTARCPVLLSPVFDKIEPVNIVNWITEDNLPVRFQLQLHKYIWHPMTLGV